MFFFTSVKKFFFFFPFRALKISSIIQKID